MSEKETNGVINKGEGGDREKGQKEGKDRNNLQNRREKNSKNVIKNSKEYRIQGYRQKERH